MPMNVMSSGACAVVALPAYYLMLIVAAFMLCSALARLSEQLPQLLATSQHSTFQRVLAPLLLPCLAAITQRLSLPSGDRQLEVCWNLIL